VCGTCIARMRDKKLMKNFDREAQGERPLRIPMHI
jgi:hypothetical protein